MKSLRLITRAVVLAIATVGVAFAVNSALFVYMQSIIGVFFLSAVVLAAYLGGFAAGVVASLLSTVAIAYFMPPAGSLAVRPSDSIGLAVYAALAVAMSWFAASRRKWGEALTAARGDLEHVLLREQKSSDELRFLSEASVLLASSLDYQTTLSNLARMAVPTFADWAQVDLVQDGRLHSVAIWHSDPEKVALAWQLQQRYPQDPNSPYGPPNVIRTGQPELVPHLPDEQIAEVAHDAEHLELLRKLKLTSYLTVPLRGHDEILGAITFVGAESGRHYDESDLAFAEELARRAAVAVENARLYREAQEANRAKDEFLAMLSHELRNPITSIVGWVQILQSGAADPATVKAAIDSIGASATLQSRLIDDMLDVSRILLGKLRLDVTRVDLATVIGEGVDAVRPIAEEKEINLELDVNCDSCVVNGDAARLQQVVWNLAANAVKFTPAGGRVKVTLRRSGYTAQIVVEDTGEGINPEFLPHVFERFTQDASGRRRGGLGLGLAIARALVEMHGGEIRAESDGPGKGARFTIDLPLVEVESERQPVAATA